MKKVPSNTTHRDQNPKVRERRTGTAARSSALLKGVQQLCWLQDSRRFQGMWLCHSTSFIVFYHVSAIVCLLPCGVLYMMMMFSAKCVSLRFPIPALICILDSLLSCDMCPFVLSPLLEPLWALSVTLLYIFRL